MATQADIGDFIRRRISIGRVQPSGSYYLYGGLWAPRYYGTPLPAVQELASELLADAEFQGLRLGGFLNTPTGEFLEQAVQTVVPRTLSPEFELIVAALKLAADRQRGETFGKALLALGGTFLVGALIKEIGKAA